MFLLERFIGVGIYMLVLMFVCVLLTKTSATCKSTLKFYTICLCIMAFFYRPYVTADLYRIYDIVAFYAEMDFLYFWNNFVLESSIPLAELLYWCVGKTGINALLPTFSAFVCYSLIFYIIKKTQELFFISKRNVAYTLFFIMTTSLYISVIGGIRMMLALSMIAFSYFRITVEKKLNLIDIVLCSLAIFMHAMGIVVIGICLLVLLFDNRRRAIWKITFTVTVGITGIVFIYKFNDIVNNLYVKFLEYVLGDRYSDIWEYIMGVLIMMLLGVLVCEYRRMHKDEGYLLLRLYNTMVIACMVVALIFCFEFSIFYRFGGQLAVILSIPMLMVTLEKTGGKASRVIRRTNFKSVFLIICAVVALISCMRGSLNSLKFFEL